jgi:hypothetical protein
MIPDRIDDPLVIILLLWLCCMLPHLWPSLHRGMPTRPGAPIKPKRRRSREPKPFAGLTHKPHCALYEQETNKRQLQRVLTAYISYYHRLRTHLSLEMDCPHPHAVEPPEVGKVMALLEVGGLHHHDEQQAA